MKISLNLIKKYVEIPNTLDIKKLAYDLTVSTVEVEKIIDLSKRFENIIIGKINEILPHPNADKLKICKVDFGNNQIYDIVCGGSNLKTNMKVAVAKQGATVHWHGKSEPVKIKNSKIRGILSYGMICASSEIELYELFPTEKENAIIDLSNFNVEAGTTLSDTLGFNDYILEIDNKSLTNRPDLWGHYGIAREISTIYKLPLKDFPPFEINKKIPDIKINITDSSKCSRYMAIQIKNMPSSNFEIQSALWKVGIKPINSIVDITNYAMIVTGQPTHAFDADKIQGTINIRPAKKDEKIELLNHKEIFLSENDLIICDDEKPIALAGIMGGISASATNYSKNFIIEIANFNALNIRKTVSKHNIRTEASCRYEKNIDPERCDITFNLIMNLLSNEYKNFEITKFSDIFLKPSPKNKIIISLEWMQKRLGKKISNEKISNILSYLGFKTSFDEKTIRINVPTWRSTGDITISNDIVEEIARIYGLENFDCLPISTTFDHSINQPQIDLERRIKEYLAFRCGMREIFSYPWVKTEHQIALFDSTDKMLSLSTPPAPNEKFLANSLLTNLCGTVSKNLRYFSEFGIFEVAQVFSDKNFKNEYNKQEFLPTQENYLSGAFVAKNEEFYTLFKKAKGIIEYLPKFVNSAKLSFIQKNKPIWADETVWLNLISNEEIIGNLALLSNERAFEFEIKNSSVMLFELNLDLLKSNSSRTNSYKKYSDFPVVDYDISLLFDQNIKWQEIEKILNKKTKNNKLIQKFEFIGEYYGKQIPSDKKSITIRLSIGSYEKTLSSSEIEKCANSINKTLNKLFGAELRNK